MVLAASIPPRARLSLTRRRGANHDFFHEAAHLIASEQIGQHPPYAFNDVSPDRQLISARGAQLLEIDVVGKKFLG